MLETIILVGLAVWFIMACRHMRGHACGCGCDMAIKKETTSCTCHTSQGCKGCQSCQSCKMSCSCQKTKEKE